MIRIKSITIEEFRGIRSLQLNFNQKNFAICGPNGTGKSGVVDAIEFALTGSISRLSGKGTGNVSIKEHAPHVSARNNPEKSKVTLTVFVPRLNKEVTIERNVMAASNPTYKPDTEEIREVMMQVATHPEFVLTRREIIKYVLSSPGDRAKEIQSLLRLDEVEQLREMFNRIRGTDERQIAPCQTGKESAKSQLISAVGVVGYDEKNILEAVNAKRALLSLAAINDFDNKTSFKDGLTTATSYNSKVPKTVAKEEIEKLIMDFDSLNSEDVKKNISNIIDEIETMLLDPLSTKDVTREQFLRTAIGMADAETCPVCDQEISLEELTARVKTKIKRFTEITNKRNELERRLEPTLRLLQEIDAGITNVCKYGPQLATPIEIEVLRTFSTEIEEICEKLEKFELSQTIIDVLKRITVPDEVVKKIKTIESAVNAIPDPSEQDIARDYLTVAQEKLDIYRSYSAYLVNAIKQAELTNKIYDLYAKVSIEALEDIYKQVENVFGELYRSLNSDDEQSFSAKLASGAGKLNLDVDFYGKGFFPPGAYHSEGHQDSMGICLYLSLMKYLLGDQFTFVVLDDVLTSIDSGHRREVCKMLIKYFPETQFVFTTHDPIWLRHMIAEGLVASDKTIEFQSWNVDGGPTQIDEGNVWTKIDDALEINDVHHAASLLRTYLESFFDKVCNSLKAKVVYQNYGSYDLGSLLDPAIKGYKELLAMGKKSATSWGKVEDEREILEMELKLSNAKKATSYEQWMINPAIHYNEWANFQKSDFIPVIEAFRQLTGVFVCQDENCGSIKTVLFDRRIPQTLRCNCEATNINLLTKQVVKCYRLGNSGIEELSHEA